MRTEREELTRRKVDVKNMRNKLHVDMSIGERLQEIVSNGKLNANWVADN